MRGKLLHVVSVTGLTGNIPAYAGKTHWLPMLRYPKWEHPRVCGENKLP